MSRPSRPENWKPLDEQPALRPDWESLASDVVLISSILFVLWIAVRILGWILP